MEIFYKMAIAFSAIAAVLYIALALAIILLPDAGGQLIARLGTAGFVFHGLMLAALYLDPVGSDIEAPGNVSDLQDINP